MSHLDPDKITPARFRWRTICFQDVARATLFILLALSQLSFLFYFFLLGEEPHILAQFSLVGLAAYLHALIFLAIAELTYWVAKALYKLDYFKSQCRYVINGRHLYTYLSLFCAALFILGGLYVTFSDPVYTRVTVPIRNLHNGDVKVALLSDLHIGPTVGQKRMSRIAELTNDLDPDIVAISGDLADGFVRDFEGAASPLCKLKPKYGVYFATGNHEYMHGNVEEWFAYLEGCNVTVLHNSQKRIVLPNGDKICVAGADDLYAAKAHFPGHGMDAKKAIVGCQPGDAVIMLAHQPNAARVMLDDRIVSKRVDLILSGHTHGGQMYLFVPIIYLVNAFARGLYYNEPTGVYVYVSAGVNYFGPPIKMFGACEIIDITLKPSPEILAGVEDCRSIQCVH
ncbi:unnamed protein product [Cylicostephanus goldi]|uniref:Calcineurin-like phosphoesterase domain-containing protein n=1 Tax=Cylicostephanus goldi TaxID=71465 RepID=A0A3P6QFS9_CYLGO|nr:unnamed protein product [Cylicostephanus goldi]